MRAAALATQFGFSVVGSLVGGVLLGQYLDSRFGTAPLCFLLGLLGGFLCSFYLIYVIYRTQIQPKTRSTQPAPASRRTAVGEQPEE